MPTQHFTVSGRYLGNRQVDGWLKDSTFGTRRTYSVAYFCPQCGDIWARLLVEGSDWTQCWSESCPKHGGGHIDRTCKFEWWPCELEKDWPIEAVRYVLLRELSEQRNR